MRHILTLFDGRVVVLAVVLLALAALVAVVVGRRTDTVWQLFLALCGSALIATMTIGNWGHCRLRHGLRRRLHVVDPERALCLR